MISGLNHLTLAVRDLERAFRFYRDVLGFAPVAKWDAGAYFAVGPLWFCLAVDPATRARPLAEYTHIAFAIRAEDFAAMAARIRACGAPLWRENQSEGASLYFLDPDGHKLELHVGDMASRLAACRQQPYRGMVFFDRRPRP